MVPFLLLSLAAPAAPLDPAPLRASLDRALPAVESMGACAGMRPRYERRSDRAFAAYSQVAAAADSLFGPEASLAPWESPRAAAGCGARAFARYERDAETRLAEARERLAAVTARMRGLWLGTMPVCAGQVAEVTVEPYRGDAMWRLEIELVPALRERLPAETRPRVGKPMSVRIDGEAVMEPNLNQPLSTGGVSLAAPEREGLERIRSAALRPC